MPVRSYEWVFEQLLTPTATEVPGEYYTGLDNAVSGDPYELSNGYLNLAPGRLADLQDLADDHAACAGDGCRFQDSRSI